VRGVDCPETVVIVEARDLDTDERAIVTCPLPLASGVTPARAHIEEIVRRLHPGARLRSFGPDAASFLDSQRLVVVHWRSDPAAGAPDESPQPVQPGEQQELFVA
jgi:hypothetical protein